VAAGGIAAVFRQVSAFTAAVLFCGALSWVGAIPVALLPFVFLVAVYCATGRTWLGGLATASVVLIVGFVTLGVETALFCGLFLLSGVALGSGIRRKAAFGTIVTVVTAWICVIFAGYLAFHMTWAGWEREAAGWYDSLLAETREVAQNAEEQEAAYDFLHWTFVEHWADVSIGLMFASFLMCAVLATGAAAAWVRLRHKLAGPRTTFAKMRPPEWLVWPAIGCAVLWFIEQRIPNDVLRAISWNAAIGIAAVYWLNGLSILVYALRHLRLHVFVVIALLVFMM